MLKMCLLQYFQQNGPEVLWKTLFTEKKSFTRLQQTNIPDIARVNNQNRRFLWDICQETTRTEIFVQFQSCSLKLHVWHKNSSDHKSNIAAQEWIVFFFVAILIRSSLQGPYLHQLWPDLACIWAYLAGTSPDSRSDLIRKESLWWNPSCAKDLMCENKNQPIKFQYFSKIWKESKYFQGMEYWYWPNMKTAEICKIFKLSLTAAKLGQILHFKGLLMKEANIASFNSF